MKANKVKLFLGSLLITSVIASASAFSLGDTIMTWFDGSTNVQYGMVAPSDTALLTYKMSDGQVHALQINPGDGLVLCNSDAFICLYGVPQDRISGLADTLAGINTLIDTKASTASVSSLNSSLSSFSVSLALVQNVLAIMDQNLHGTSTTMLVGVGTSTKGFMSSTDKAKLDVLSANTGIAYEGTTTRVNAFPVFKSATVSSGVAVFNLTTDGTSGGTALFPNGVVADSVNVFVSDASASYQMAYAFSNGNKTLTVTANKLTTANILTGILGQATANGSVVKLQVYGY